MRPYFDANKKNKKLENKCLFVVKTNARKLPNSTIVINNEWHTASPSFLVYHL